MNLYFLIAIITNNGIFYVEIKKLLIIIMYGGHYVTGYTCKYFKRF
jgi:hypothetical protein|nr:MAG TPA: hypothetical protein [Caudoviricetes sp.]DAT59090.1 MAG TPA: hypothetical protein [Caudoviricetes sp.]